MNFFEEMFNTWKEYHTLDETLRSELLSMDEEAAREAFSTHLQFGTSGLRGIMGVGTNRMNEYVIDHVTRGLADYILDCKAEEDEMQNPKVVIAYDSRHNSRLFAEKTADALSKAGIDVFLFSSLVTVSILSFAIRKLKCDYGIMITASHNSKEYNGYKVYNSKGGQILPQEADAIHDFIEREPFFSEPSGVIEKTWERVHEGEISEVYDEVVEAFIAETMKYDTKEKVEDLKVVYSPLNGAGLIPVREVLSRLGVGNLTVVPEQEFPDGDFPTCPEPNPENKQVYDLGLELLRAEDADVLLVTDPDCDRVGLATKTKIFTGNEIAMLLFDYLCKRARTNGNLFAARSVVSSPMLDSIAKKYDIAVRKTLIGFKYIAALIDEEDREFFFGFEEGNGYLATTYIRDKDGISTAMLLANMAAYYKEQGVELEDVLKDLYREHGYFVTDVVPFHFEGLLGEERRERIMDHLRQKKDTEGCNVKWFGRKPEAIIDYAQQEKLTLKGIEAYEDLPTSNIVEVRYPQDEKIIIRPSGTEPKLKAYLISKGRHAWKAKLDMSKMDEEVSDFIYDIQNEMMGEKL